MVTRRDALESFAMLTAIAEKFDKDLCVWLVDLSKKDWEA